MTGLEVTTGFDDVERFRGELTGYCYRMLGSAFEADDAVQDCLLRAWRSLEKFEGRSSLRSWLYRIATNVCLDMLDGRARRAWPMDFGPSSTAAAALPHVRTEITWLEPLPDDPAVVVEDRDSIRLAFVAALQLLPPRQRAVLILREVLRWSAAEVADLLDSSVPSVNSALQRARATLDHRQVGSTAPMDDAQRALLERYVDAFQRYDMDGLTSLLHADATQSMPPYELWLSGRSEILAFLQGTGAACRGSRLVPTSANGMPAFGQYKPDGGGGFTPWALQVLDCSGGCVVDLIFFLDTDALFPLFGLPDHLNRRHRDR